MIYMNGRPTNFENIFDAVNPSRPDLWYTVSAKDTGRPMNDILNDWVQTKKTYYYLNGVKTTFELKKEGDTKMTITDLQQAIASEKPRSAWGLGVKVYAEELAEDLAEAIQGGYFTEDKMTDRAALTAQLLNGADSWHEYSWGGCALVYDGDIAQRLCTPSEYGRSHEGERRPNSREEWLDIQARALTQAAKMIIRLAGPKGVK